MSLMGRVFTVTSLLFGVFDVSMASRILAIFPIPSQGHQIIYQPLLDSLAKRGHELVVLTTDPVELVESNIKQIDLSFTYHLKELENLKDKSLSGSEMLQTVFHVVRTVAKAQLESSEIQELLKNETEHFDVVIVEWSGATLMNAFAHHFKAPLIGIVNGGAFINSHEAMGNPTHPIVYPSILLPFSEDLSLTQRIASVMFSIWYRYLYFIEDLPLQNEIATNYFGEETPNLWKLEKSADLLLVNSYQALGNVQPTVPTTIYLGGIHSNSRGILSEDLKSFLERATDHVIYINIGDERSGLTESRLEKLCHAIDKLGMDVIWNMAGPQPINISKQLYFGVDLPQEEIMAHPKVSLFITMGGQRNIEDAIHYTVPIFGISSSSYFEHYLRQMQKYETGQISVIDFESKTLVAAKMEEVVNHQIYKTNMINLKRLILDNPMSTLDRATWWIEYVIRNHGTEHLRSPMRNISWFQYFMLDVLITVLVCILTIFCVCAYIVWKLVKYSKSLPIEMVTRGSKCKVL